MSISRDQRALVVVAYMASANQPWYMHFGQFSAVNIVRGTLGLNYKTVDILEDANATKAKFINKLKTAANKSTIKAIDVIMITHGGNDRLYFYDNDYTATSVGAEILGRGMHGKLRLYYSTACYGVTDNRAMRNAGFETAIGAERINTNGTIEFPVVLSSWTWGGKISDCISAGLVGYKACDDAAKALNNKYKDANSYKEIWGKHHITIDSEV